MENDTLQYIEKFEDSRLSNKNQFHVDDKTHIPGLIRSRKFIPTDTKRVYFEASVKCLGKDGGFVAIGLISESSSLQDLPGYSGNCYGYHSNGNIYSNGISEYWNAEYKDGDTVGCYADLENELLYFTKNGCVVNESKLNRRDVLPFPDVLYPAIGMSSKGAIVSTNFGEKDFVFDFEGIIRNERV